jgi:hypothetical protein
MLTEAKSSWIQYWKGFYPVKKGCRVFLFTVFILILLACNALSRIPPAQKSSEETPSPILSTPIVSQTPAIQISRPCPIPAGTPNQIQISNYETLPSNIVQFLNSGGTLDTLLLALEDAGMIRKDPPGWVEKDFTGDGFYDIAMSLIDPEAEFVLPPGMLLLDQCQGDHYDLVFQSAETTDWGAPEILSSEDLTGDQISDLLIGRQSCGAHTCFTQLEAFVWNGTTLENRMQGTSEDMPSPGIEVDPPSMQFTITAEGIGSVGAGPFRRFLRQWTWDGEEEAFLPSPDTYLPSNFRIHVLQDADQADENGDYGKAIELYTKVIEDDELQDYIDPAVERLQLAAYASFRLMLTYLLVNDVAAGEGIHSSMMMDYPSDSPASDFVQLADTFWREYQSSGDIGSACLAAQSFADSHQETILDALYYGYANPTYTPIDICPFTN